MHPKMDMVKTLLIEHFAQKRLDKEDAVASGGGDDLSGDSRVMVFASFRQNVDLLITMLNKENPLIRAVPFFGQGTDKHGNKGYSQKGQLEVGIYCAQCCSFGLNVGFRSSRSSKMETTMFWFQPQLVKKASILARSTWLSATTRRRPQSVW